MSADPYVIEELRQQAIVVGISPDVAELVANFAYVQQERFLLDAIDWLKTTPAVTLSGKNGGYELLAGYMSHRGEP